MVKLLYFAALVDKLGQASEVLELPNHVTDVRALVALLKQRGGVWSEVFNHDALRITVNKQFSELTSSIKSGDEIAFISAWM